MPETIPLSRAALAEALALSAEILRNIELNELSPTNIALKASRLARLLNDFDYQTIMAYEAGGYPSAADGIPPEVWRLAVLAGRNYEWTDPATKKADERVYVESIAELEKEIQMSEPSLAAARDPARGAREVPGFFGPGNVFERQAIRQSARNAAQQLASRRTMIYQYAVHKHYELSFSGIADDVFT
jgi:soluble lytic murein transglycosylase-like protein